MLVDIPKEVSEWYDWKAIENDCEWYNAIRKAGNMWWIAIIEKISIINGYYMKGVQ